MKTSDLTYRLDKEFKIADCTENLIEFAVTPDNQQFVNPAFLRGQTGLMIKANETVERVFTVVFITDEIIDKVSIEQNGLIFTHHHFDYYENEKGLQAIRLEQIEKLIKADHSLYVAHAPLDTHETYGTSIALAKVCGISIENFFLIISGLLPHYWGGFKEQLLRNLPILFKKIFPDRF